MPFAKSPLVSLTNNKAIRIANTIAVAFIVLALPNFFASVIVILVVVVKCMAEDYQSKVIVLFSLSNFKLCVPFMQRHLLIENRQWLKIPSTSMANAQGYATKLALN